MLFHSLIVDPLAYQDLELEYLHFWRLGLDYSVLNFLSFKPLNKETETQKSWKICQNFNSWMMKFTIVQKSHLALSNLAKLVFWSILSFKKPTSHGVWMPNDCNLNKYVSIVRLNHGHLFFNWSLFSWNPELLCLCRQIGQVNSEAFGVFLAKIISTILVQWVLCPCFPLFNHHCYKKINTPNFHLGLGFEFGTQRLVIPWRYSIWLEMVLLRLESRVKSQFI